MSKEKDFEVRKALAWAACHKLSKIWSSNITKKHQRKAFPFSHRTYFVIWSRCMDGNDVNPETPAFLCYTRMLGMAFNVPWKDKVRNEDLYGRLPSASSKVASRRLKLAGH